MLADQAETVWTAPTTVQGLGFDGPNLWQVLQSGSTTEEAFALASAKFNTITTTGTGSWNLNGDGNYGGNFGFDPIIPNGPGSIAQFGDGTTNTLNNSAINVTIDGAYTLGSLVFNPTNGAGYALVGDNLPGHGLVLDSGAGQGASIVVTSGSHSISSNLTLADAGGLTFNIAQGSSLALSGPLNESGGSRALTVTGGGTLSLGSGNSFSGGTTVSGATLQTTASGALGAGPLTLNSQPTAGSTVLIGGTETISGLSGTIAQNSPNVLFIGPGANLNVRQAANTTFQGTLVTSGAFNKSGDGTLEVVGAGIMDLGSSLTVSDGGTLRLRLSGGAMVSSGVVARVSGSATLELAGSVSNLSSAIGPGNRVAIVNNSTSASGLLVTGTNQQAGGIDGSGNIVVTDGASLAADHIVQTSLVIGGTLASPARVTIDASDDAGHPLDEPTGPMTGSPPTFALGGLAWRDGVFGASGSNSSALLTAATTGTKPASMIDASAFSGSALAGAMGGALSMGGHLVPEPASWLLALLAILPLMMAIRVHGCR